MPFNPDGTFTRTNGALSGPNLWEAQRDSADPTIKAPRHDTHDQDLANGLEALVLRAGTNSPTANLPMAGFRHTNVGDATARNQYASLGQVMDRGIPVATAGGTANTITAAYNPAFPALVDGMAVLVRLTADITVTNPTLQIDVNAAKTIERPGSVAVQLVDMTAGKDCVFLYNQTADRWVLGNPTYLTNPMSAQGDVIIGGTAGAGARLAKGAENTLLAAGAADPEYKTLSALLDAVFGNTQGGFLYRDASAWAFLGPGTAGQVLTSGGAAANPSFADAPSGLTVGAAQATTSGTIKTFGSLPAGIDRIDFGFAGTSLDGTDNLLVQIGDSEGLETAGYVSSSLTDGGAAQSTSGFIMATGDSAVITSGIMSLIRIDGNQWVASHAVKNSTAGGVWGGGDKTLSGELTQIAILPTGANSFDAGKVNIQYHIGS